MRYAIIQTGGKQYRAVEGETIEVDKLETEVGKKVDLKEVLLVRDEGNVMVGAPTVADAKVAATVVAQDKGDKITVFKYKPKIRYRVKTGHRQQYTRLMIDSIEAKGLAKAAPKAEAKTEAPAKAAPAAKAKAPALKAKKPAAKKAAVKKKAAKKTKKS